MDTSLGSIFTFYEFTTGRRQFALRQVKAAAQHRGCAELVDHCDKAIKHEAATRQLEARWRSEPYASEAAARPNARKVDILVDNTLIAIRDVSVSQKRGAPPDDPIHANVDTFLKRVFTIDLQDLIKLPFVEESAAVDDIVTLLNGELAPYVKELGLARLAKQLTTLAKEYREALDAPPPSLITWGKVRAARAEGQENLYEAVCIILGAYHQRTPEAVAAREALLAPIRAQNEAIGLYIRSRRSVDDVNPDTGEEEPGSGEATGEEPSKAAARKGDEKSKGDGKADAKAGAGKAEAPVKEAAEKPEAADADA